MVSNYSQGRRAELLIAVGRAILSSFSLLAIWLDPSEPSRLAETAYAILAAYVLYSLVVLLFVFVARAAPRKLTVAVHALDLAIAALVMFVTERSTSPFFAYFVFALAAASLRWGWKAVLGTGAVSSISFLVIGTTSADFADPSFELNRFIIRAAYLPVITLLLAYVGAHYSKLRRDLARLASWPPILPDDTESVVRSALAQAAAILKAPEIAMVWREPGEHRLRLDLWSGGKLQRSREPPGRFEHLVADPIAARDFLCSRKGDSWEVLFRSRDGLRRWRGDPLHPALQEQLGPGPVLSWTLAGQTFAGRLFALGMVRPTADELELGRVTARQVAAELDHLGLLGRLRHAGALDERLRIARDLHDGVLQGLAAAGMKLHAAVGMLDGLSPEALARLNDVQEILADEQRELRAISQELKPSAAPAGTERDLAGRLGEVCARVGAQWNLAVSFRSPAPVSTVPAKLAQEACHLVYEALVNAARHGHASAARVELAPGEPGLRLVVEDDGEGFSFQGTYALEELASRKIGPLALRERVASLGGTLRLVSRREGARLEIGLPLADGELETETSN